MSTPAIELRSATKRFRTPTGAAYTALRDLKLSVAPGEFCAIVGPTGCGKSTTLSLISGLERVSEGEVLVNGAPVRGIGDGIGFMFQNDAVFPWKSVLGNVAAGPLFRGVPKEDAIARADRVVVLTAGPGTVKATFDVDLPRPRRVQEIRFEPAFVELYHRIWESLRDEVQLAYARTTTAA